MRSVYRRLLYLYPHAFRSEFGDEMTSLFAEMLTDERGFAARSLFLLREIAGLLKGAVHERLCSFDFPSIPDPISRRFVMRPGFRFPKSTAVLMMVILAGVLLAMEKATSIVRSLPASAAGQADYPDLFQGLVMICAAACLLAVLAWAALFAVRRSGMHRLSEVSTGGGKPFAARNAN